MTIQKEYRMDVDFAIDDLATAVRQIHDSRDDRFLLQYETKGIARTANYSMVNVYPIGLRLCKQDIRLRHA